MTTTRVESDERPSTFPTPSAVPRSSSRRSRQLDFLRGVAILLVLHAHLLIEIPEQSPIAGVLHFFREAGWVGVDLFFVLSGFLVGGLLINELDRYGRIDAKRFLIRRGLKIYPLYYVFMGYLFAVPLAKALVANEAVGTTLAGLWERLWPNLLFLNGYIGPNPALHTWTLAIEEHFYLLLPFFLILASRSLSIRGIALVCAAILIPVTACRLVIVFHPDIPMQTMIKTHLRIDSLFVGVAIRCVADGWPTIFAAIGRYRYPLIVAGAFLLSCVPFFPNEMKRSVGYTLTTLGAAAVLWGSFHVRASDFTVLRAPAERLVSVVCWVGTYSYSIYVWHVTIFRIVERQIDRLGYSPNAAGATLYWLAAVAVIWSVTILLSALISRVVEIPVLKFRDRFFPSRSRSIPAAASSDGATANGQ